jgi:hypothetical protein
MTPVGAGVLAVVLIALFVLQSALFRRNVRNRGTALAGDAAGRPRLLMTIGLLAVAALCVVVGSLLLRRH